MPVSKIGNIILMGNIGLSDQGNPGRNNVKDIPEKPYDLVGLFKMYTPGPGLGPEKGDCIQPNEGGAVPYVHEQNLYNPHQDIGVLVIKINLIR